MSSLPPSSQSLPIIGPQLKLSNSIQPLTGVESLQARQEKKFSFTKHCTKASLVVKSALCTHSMHNVVLHCCTFSFVVHAFYIVVFALVRVRTLSGQIKTVDHFLDYSHCWWKFSVAICMFLLQSVHWISAVLLWRLPILKERTSLIVTFYLSIFKLKLLTSQHKGLH